MHAHKDKSIRRIKYQEGIKQMRISYKVQVKAFDHRILKRYMFLHDLGLTTVNPSVCVKSQPVRKERYASYALQSPHGHKKRGEALTNQTYKRTLRLSTEHLSAKLSRRLRTLLSGKGREAGVQKAKVTIQESYGYTKASDAWNAL